MIAAIVGEWGNDGPTCEEPPLIIEPDNVAREYDRCPVTSITVDGDRYVISCQGRDFLGDGGEVMITWEFNHEPEINPTLLTVRVTVPEATPPIDGQFVVRRCE